MKMPKYDFYSLQIWMQNEDDQQILVENSIAASSTLYVLSFMLILRTNVTFYILLRFCIASLFKCKKIQPCMDL